MGDTEPLPAVTDALRKAAEDATNGDVQLEFVLTAQRLLLAGYDSFSPKMVRDAGGDLLSKVKLNYVISRNPGWFVWLRRGFYTLADHLKPPPAIPAVPQLAAAQPVAIATAVPTTLGLQVINTDKDEDASNIRHIPSKDTVQGMSDKRSRSNANRGTPKPNRGRGAKQAPVQTVISKQNNRQATAKPAKPAQRPPAPPPPEPVHTVFELLFEYLSPFYSEAEIYNFLAEWDGPSPEYSDEEIAMLP